ncbi:cation diffusion facilitator family transporter [Desulfobacula sp.]|uniref:cation diffusion facilitator family transporter n=1 Tax=Desulfobacula sp. TaxID=2593537 RepID=UPI00262E1A76|nr:cation diffusion facilitator family transporter [Desulfobacula sp.]
MDKRAQIQNITLIGLVINILLSVTKFLIGFFGNSQAVVADALHSFSDTTSDLVILFGVKYWTAPPDDDHPYGHQKIESFITIIIGLILILVACIIGYNGIISLQERNQHQLKWIVIIGPLISIIIKELLFRVTYKVGIKTNSSSLKANAWHHRTDALSSIPVLVAVVASLIDPRLGFLDHIGAIVVSAFIIKIGLEIFFTNINDLLDTGISKEKIIEMEKTINHIQNVRGVHKLRTRKLANYIYIDLHLEVDGELSVIQGHDISEEVKQTLIQNNPKIIDVMIHLEPCQESSFQ